MTLTPEQKAELERLGPKLVAMRLNKTGASAGAEVLGCEKLALLRKDAEEWLAGQDRAEERQRVYTLRWAIVAGIGTMAGVAIAVWQAWPSEH